MPYVEAPSLATLIQHRWLRWKASAIEDVVARVGTALARFHDVTRNTQEVSRADAELPLSWALQHAGRHAASLRAAADSAQPVQVYDDINPSHVLVQPNTITLIDLPSGVKVAHPHRDLAWFTDKLFVTLVRSIPKVPASRQLANFTELRQALLVAYFEEAGVGLTEADDHLVAAFQAFYLARRERRRQDLSIASRFRGWPLRLQAQRLRSTLSR